MALTPGRRSGSYEIADPIVSDGMGVRAGFYGWKNVVCLFVIYGITIGFINYGFTVIFPAMIQAEGWGRGDASLAHTIRSLLVGLIAPLAALSLVKLGPRITVRIGFTLGAVALALLGTVTTELWHWTLLWGLAMPATFALSGVLSVQTVVNFWFSRRRATALGVVVTGAAVAGFVGAPLFTYLIEASGTWRSGWLAASGFCVVGVIVTFFLQNTPADLGQHPDGIDPDPHLEEDSAAQAHSAKPKAKGTYRTKESWTLREALRTQAVWLYLVCSLGQLWAINMVTVHGVLHLIDKGFSQMQSASVIANFILFSGFARFPVGVLADRVEPRILASIALFGMVIAVLGLWQVPSNLFWVLAISGTYGFCFGSMVITFSMIIANYYGPTAFAPIKGFFTPISILVSAPLPFVAGLIFDHYGSYDWAFIPVATMVFLSAICSLFLYPPQKRPQDLQ